MESILKSGFSQQELGDLLAAEAIFRRVIREYPNSSASSLAEERLKKSNSKNCFYIRKESLFYLEILRYHSPAF